MIAFKISTVYLSERVLREISVQTQVSEPSYDISTPVNKYLHTFIYFDESYCTVFIQQVLYSNVLIQ